MQESLLVMMGGALGAVARYGLGFGMAQWLGLGFPYGTLLINLSGAFFLGYLVAPATVQGWPAGVRLLLGTGFCGGFTTFSTFSVEVLTLWQRGQGGLAALYLILSLVGGVLAAALGFMVGRGG